MPTPEEQAGRLTAVERALCLIFDDGHAATSGSSLPWVYLISEDKRPGEE